MAKVPAQTSWSRLKDLYFAASELTGDHRQCFIDEHCPVGDGLRDELLRLLRAAEAPDGALDTALLTQIVPPPAPAPGTCLNHYRIGDLIARGGVGAVYRATDTRLKRTVAIKVLRWEMIRDGGRERFIREAEIASSLTHPNVVAIYDIGTADALDYIAMEYVPGLTLRERLNRGAMDITTALIIARQIADALAALHGIGIVHRDVKPTNVVVTESDLVKLLDFGLAKATLQLTGPPGGAADDAQQLSKVGMIMGTFAYMSPEQAEGKPVDRRSDVFSFGGVLYEMLTGRAPFTGDSDLAVLSAVLRSDPPPIASLAPHVPREAQELVMKCLQKNPADRWQMQNVQRALDDLLREGARHDTVRTGSGPRARPSIAVLPFANLTPVGDAEYFADGLTDELINALSRLDGLRVVSRTSAFEFKGKAMSIRTVGTQLGVESVLEGSVRRAGNRLRVTVQLAKVSDGCQLWASRFDREMTDVFAIQDEIAQTIASTLHITLREPEGTPLVKRYTSDLEAYHLYLRGRFHWNKRSAAGFEKAREYFEAALARDPEYAPAYAGLADYHISVASWGMAAPETAWPAAGTAAMKAMAIDSSIPEAHIGLAAYRTYYEWNWTEGEREFRVARQLNPADTNLCTQFATYLIQCGRFAEASSELRRAADVDPLSATVNTCIAGVAYYSRDFQRAIDICRQALEIAPDDIELTGVLGMSYEANGNLGEALNAYRLACELSHDHPLLLALLAEATARTGQMRNAEELAERLRLATAREYVPPIALGWVYTALGDFDRAFEWLEKAADAHDMMLAYLRVGPCYDSLRSHPRFVRLLARIGMLTADTSSKHH